MILRPYGLVIGGVLETGLELVLDGDRIDEIRPHTGLPGPFVVSPAFVNAHSHLEYRSMLGAIDAPEYLPWIRELIRLKALESDDQVREACHLAARENRATGVAWIGEHSDRPFAGEALAAEGIGGAIFQEVITFFQLERRLEILAEVEARAERNRHSFSGTVTLSPHAFHTVDPDTLTEIGQRGDPVSIHLAESKLENQLLQKREGLLADPWRVEGLKRFPIGISVVEALRLVGLVRPGVQFVHACDVSDQDIASMAEGGVTVAHCPRSNVRLRCPIAPVRRMLEAGINVGLGLDSVASSGEIDMFAEMRAALTAGYELGQPLTAEQVWQMATTKGHQSFGPATDRVWDIEVGSTVPLIKIGVSDALWTEDLILNGTIDSVGWVTERAKIGP
ncbi:MAG: amidohydrolase family protein [Fimbriimonas sp.]